MGHRSIVVVAFVVCVASGVPDTAAAQAVTPPTIHRVTLQRDAGVLTLTGTGLGPDLFVTVDGLPVATLPGASETQMEVLAPATVLTTPGSYRLTVVDPVRQVGDEFVVANQAATIALDGTAPSATLNPATGTAPAPAGSPAIGPVVPVTPRSLNGPASLSIIEDAVSPWRTAIGYQALFNSTSGIFNTASGHKALYSNSTGRNNTGSGLNALHFNTTGSWNTASGTYALYFSTTGHYNTASGAEALYHNSTGSHNTASGYQALLSNTTGGANTAGGTYALYSNTTGALNTATGYEALYNNSTGSYNTASGYQALFANTTGQLNTASGYQALLSNTTGNYNAASGSYALHYNATGALNTATGYGALYANTTGQLNTASGYQALFANTTGGANTAGGTYALYSNTTGALNTATGYEALFNTTTGANNVAVGSSAGSNATTGSYNLFLGAGVVGMSSDTNTIRIGLPYSNGVGQNQTFITGIHGTQVPGSYLQVVVNANGQLGTLTPPVQLSGSATATPLSVLQQQVQAQQATIAELERLLRDAQERSRAQQTTSADVLARLARLETLVSARAGRQ